MWQMGQSCTSRQGDAADTQLEHYSARVEWLTTELPRRPPALTASPGKSPSAHLAGREPLVDASFMVDVSTAWQQLEHLIPSLKLTLAHHTPDQHSSDRQNDKAGCGTHHTDLACVPHKWALLCRLSCCTHHMLRTLRCKGRSTFNACGVAVPQWLSQSYWHCHTHMLLASPQEHCLADAPAASALLCRVSASLQLHC